MEPGKRKQIIQALKNKDFDALKNLNKNKIYIASFLDLLIFTSSYQSDDSVEPVWIDNEFTIPFRELLNTKVDQI